MTCTGCGAQLAEGARFCSSCGRPVARRSPPPDAIERKTVSALFVDLAGFTASAVDVDPEDVAQRLQAFHSTVREQAERHGGRVEKLIGDGVFAVFGAPTAHEDDAERAVRAALQIQTALAELNQSKGLELVARVAVTTGEAVVRLEGTGEDREGVVGDVVNLASRLEALAPHGGVLVDQRTHAATQQVADYERRDPVEVKGQPEPLPTWVAIDISDRAEDDPEDAPPFVGRSDSMQMLSDAYERVVTDRTMQLVTISGEPGVGKSRLVAEFRRVLAGRPDRPTWRQGRCLSYGDGISFWALGEIVKAHTGVLDGEPRAMVERKIAEAAHDLIADDGEAGWVAQQLLVLIGASAGQSTRPERFAAWTRFLEAVAMRQPLVLLVEDLHWADEALLAFLGHLVDSAPASPILLVVTARPELYESHHAWGDGHASIPLGPLSPVETARLVRELDEGASANAVQQAVDRSGGNPLYAAELVRMATEISDSAEGSIPDSIHAVIAARIDRSPTVDKDVLQAAAVIGKVFWAGAVAEATGLPRESIDEALQRLSRRELVLGIHESSMQGEVEYSFWHDLVVDVAYGQISREPRRRMHDAVGQWIEARAGERTGELSEVLAHHFTTALEAADALGETDERLRADARRHLLESGRRAENLDAARAKTFLERALDVSESTSEQAEVLVLLATIVGNVVGGTEAIELARQALSAAEDSEDTAREARAAVVLARQLWAAGEGDEARTATLHALGVAERLPPGPELASVLSRSAGVLSLQGDFERLNTVLDRALEVGRDHGPLPDYLDALKWAGVLRVEQGDVEDGVQLLREAHRGAVDGEFVQLQIVTTASLATMLYTHGLGAREAIELCETAIADGHERGLLGSADFLRVALCDILFLVGRWSEIPTQANYMIETYGMDSHPGIGGRVWLSRYLVYTKKPDHDLSDTTLAIGRQSGDHQFVVPELVQSIERRRQGGDRQGALELVGEFETVTDDRPFFRTRFLPHVAPFLEEIGEWDLLERLVEGTGEGPGEPRVAYVRGMLARGRGLLDDARSQLETALGHARKIESPWQEALVLAQQAAVDLDSGDADSAVTLLDRAEALLAIIGESVFSDAVARVRRRV